MGSSRSKLIHGIERSATSGNSRYRPGSHRSASWLSLSPPQPATKRSRSTPPKYRMWKKCDQISVPLIDADPLGVAIQSHLEWGSASISGIQSRDLLFCDTIERSLVQSKASTDLWSFLSKQNLRNHFRLVLERFRVFCSRVHWPFVTFVFRYHLGRCKPRGCHLSGAIMMPSSKECFPSESLYHRAFGKYDPRWRRAFNPRFTLTSLLCYVSMNITTPQKSRVIALSFSLNLSMQARSLVCNRGSRKFSL